MKYSFIALLAIVLIAACSAREVHTIGYLTDMQVETHWQNFLVNYNRSYTTPQEFAMRRDIFRNALIRIAQLNAQARGKTRFGVTKFADLSPAEFKSTILMNNPPAIDYELLKAHYEPIDYTGVNIPKDKTWVGTDVLTPVYDQGQCGSCWAFSATEQMESMWFVANKKLHKLSSQQIVSCDTNAYGCGGGWTYSAYKYIQSAPGQQSLSSYPYTASNTPCEFKASDVVSNIASWRYITQSGDEEEMKKYIGTTGPLSICADANSWQYYQGGVLMSADCGSQIDHCIQLVGYKTSAPTPYWIVRNSWGTDWGENGYIYLEYGKNTCLVGNVVTTVTPTSTP